MTSLWMQTSWYGQSARPGCSKRTNHLASNMVEYDLVGGTQSQKPTKRARLDKDTAVKDRADINSRTFVSQVYTALIYLAQLTSSGVAQSPWSTSSSSTIGSSCAAETRCAAVKFARGLAERFQVRREVQINNLGFELYDAEIYRHRRQLEQDYMPVDCLAMQPQVTPSMRSMLVEWIASVHHQFQLQQETLYLTVNIIDRFMLTTPISTDCFQLLGITCLLISAKVEEVFPPLIDELVNMCNNVYSAEQVRQLERMVLRCLNFRLLAPTAHFFLEHHAAQRVRAARKTGLTIDQLRRSRAVARYLLEKSLCEYSLCQYVPSILAAATIQVADVRMNLVFRQHNTPDTVLSHPTSTSHTTSKFHSTITSSTPSKVVHDDVTSHTSWNEGPCQPNVVPAVYLGAHDLDIDDVIQCRSHVHKFADDTIRDSNDLERVYESYINLYDIEE